MQYVHISHVNGEVDRAALIFDREEIETVLQALNIAGAVFSNDALSNVYDNLYDSIERMVFTNEKRGL